MANESCDLATNAQRLFILAQSRPPPIKKEFRIFPNAPPLDPGKLIFSEIMERFRESRPDDDQDQSTEAMELELELDEDELNDIVQEMLTDLVEWNYGKNFNCHICALRHLDFGATNHDDMNPGSSGNTGTISLEAIRYASYFIKNCDGRCAYRYTQTNRPQPRPKADDYEEFRLLK